MDSLVTGDGRRGRDTFAPHSGGLNVTGKLHLLCGPGTVMEGQCRALPGASHPLDPWVRAISDVISSSGWPVHRTSPALFDTEPILGSYRYATRRVRVSHEDCGSGRWAEHPVPQFTQVCLCRWLCVAPFLVL